MKMSLKRLKHDSVIVISSEDDTGGENDYDYLPATAKKVAKPRIKIEPPDSSKKLVLKKEIIPSKSKWDDHVSTSGIKIEPPDSPKKLVLKKEIIPSKSKWDDDVPTSGIKIEPPDSPKKLVLKKEIIPSKSKWDDDVPTSGIKIEPPDSPKKLVLKKETIPSKSKCDDDVPTPAVKRPRVESSPLKSKTKASNKKPAVKRPRVESSPLKSKTKASNKKPPVKRPRVESSPRKSKTKALKKKPAVSRARKKSNVPQSLSDTAWDVVEEVATLTETPFDVSMNVVNLLDSDNTVPFIARYRKEATGNMDAAKLRQLEDVYDTLKSVKMKTQSVILTVQKKGQLTDSLQKALEAAKSLDELDHLVECPTQQFFMNTYFMCSEYRTYMQITTLKCLSLYSPFKLGKKSLAEKAKALGLQTPATNLLQNSRLPIRLHQYVDPSKKGLETVENVGLGIQHILSEVISKDYQVIKKVQMLFPTSRMTVECKINRNFAKKVDAKPVDGDKFQLYYDFRNLASRLQSHQILAINRGENLKVLSVKVKPDQFSIKTLCDFILRHFFPDSHTVHPANESLIKAGIKYCYAHSIEPLIERRVRSELTRSAEKEAVSVFATNLSNLLLTAPLQGKVVMAIDPGYTHGCKVAVVGKTGDIMHTETVMLLGRNSGSYEIGQLVTIVQTYCCDVIAIGNGTGCRDAEAVVSDLIANRAFAPIETSYCIVNESGVSIYSCSDQAAQELPLLDSNLRSAVSLARRVIDPLSEYIKVEPKHLGVGMYQHDINKNVLKKTLDNVIEECISFIGLDINTCSQIALSKVAGLKDQKSRAILDWREKVGGFRNREQIKQVPGIGPKTYEQCAGFLRISAITLQSCMKEFSEGLRGTPKSKRKKQTADVCCSVNVLDSTIIHPESYRVARKIIKQAGCSINDFGTGPFIKVMEAFFTPNNVQLLAERFSVGTPTILLIAEGLKKSLDFDVRKEFQVPLFKQQYRSMSSLRVGMVLSGKVMNCCTFGAFVDVGVDRDGLIHNSNMDRRVLDGRKLGVGDHVEAEVISIDIQKNKFTLSLCSILERPKVVLR